MRIQFCISMIPRKAHKRPCRPVTLLCLFLATFCATLCRAENSFPNDVMYRGLQGEDTGKGLESLLLDAQGSHLVTRQSNESIPLSDNSIVAMAINPGTTDFWTFSPSVLKISGPTTVYITISACTQPSPKSGLNATEIYTNQTLPALQMYISTDASNTRPGPDTDATKQDMRELSLGFTNITLDDVTTDVYISVVAQNVTSDWQGGWTYQLGSSTNRIKSIPHYANIRITAVCTRWTESVRHRHFPNRSPHYNRQPLNLRSPTVPNLRRPQRLRLRLLTSLQFILRFPLKPLPLHHRKCTSLNDDPRRRRTPQTTIPPRRSQRQYRIQCLLDPPIHQRYLLRSGCSIPTIREHKNQIQ